MKKIIFLFFFQFIVSFSFTYQIDIIEKYDFIFIESENIWWVQKLVKKTKNLFIKSSSMIFFIMDHEVTIFEYLEFLNADSIQSTGKKNDVTFIDLEDKDCPIMFQDDKFVFQKTSNIKKDYCPIVEISNYGAKAFAWNLE